MEVLTQCAVLLLSLGLSLAVFMPVFSLLFFLMASGIRHSRDHGHTHG
jgi:hypothetical protein